MEFSALFDGTSAGLVVGGTVLGTFLRAGATDCRHAAAAVARLAKSRFDADFARAELAVQVREIRQDGLIRARPRHFGDNEFDEATDAMLGTRSVAALLSAHEEHKDRRVRSNARAVRTFSQASELAPVFGLAGTLVSLSQLPSEGLAQGAFASAISMAVLTTLYGLLLANLLLAPLARVLERAAEAEERERQAIVDWLAAQVTDAIPAGAPHPRLSIVDEAV
ncbi:hypothetical protein GCM10011371_30360 [Novosphingobium marinum]|uniref:Chemotaxis protein MotA n=1 Tax=Novosphingobium marinum TaxID=1514948 RepID=A0A7Y9XXS7_9SPHN|nr:MotA/TolQ/ExbB proton channel family protein [Novosphingobium marinum]NYH95011.1 chemotaxis protein MotA [Novosphingobium marinum]GGC40861.1 hypothetical protein GCM10011371_30360 [Novosphingobium marinum]